MLRRSQCKHWGKAKPSIPDIRLGRWGTTDHAIKLRTTRDKINQTLLFSHGVLQCCLVGFPRRDLKNSKPHGSQHWRRAARVFDNHLECARFVWLILFGT